MDRIEQKPDDGRDLGHDDPLDDATDDTTPGAAGGAAVRSEPEERERTLPGPGDHPAGVVVDPHHRP